MALDSVSKAERESIRVAIADPDRQLRLALRQAMMYAGFKTILDMGTAEAVRLALDETPPDLLLVAARLPDGDGAQLVRALRYSRFGRNPFLSVIMTAWPEEADDIGRLINSGTDHIVLKPVAPKIVFERIEAMIERRKPFIATANYLGPDRRNAGPRPGEEPIPTFEVPNTLRLRAKGKQVDQTTLQKAIDNSLGRINGEMVRRQAFQIAFLVERAAPLLSLGDESGVGLTAEIGMATRELTRRLEAGAMTHIADLGRTLDGHLAASLSRAEEGMWDDHDILVLRKLSQAILVGLDPNPHLGDLAGRVASAVDTYHERQRRRQTTG